MKALLTALKMREVFSDGTEGDTLLEVLLAGAAFAGFICYLLWLIGDTPLPGESVQPETIRSHTVITQEHRED